MQVRDGESDSLAADNSTNAGTALVHQALRAARRTAGPIVAGSGKASIHEILNGRSLTSGRGVQRKASFNAGQAFELANFSR
jgi:hypothetical protein